MPRRSADRDTILAAQPLAGAVTIVSDRIASQLSAAIRELVRVEVRAALKDRAGGDLVAHTALPVPRRVACAAAASGAVEGARKVARRWVATRDAWDAWLAAVSSSSHTRTPHAKAEPANVNDAPEVQVARALARRAS